MLLNSPSMQRLVESLRRLPGIGKRTAERLALHVLSAPEEEARELSNAVRDARERIRRCSVCCILTETDPCPICSDDRRDRSTVCVVERPAGAMAIEKGGGYRGLYHILHGCLNPLDGVGPEDLQIADLIKRVEAGGIKEIIVATNATAEGEATAQYLSNLLKNHDVSVTRIAHGVPMGGGLEYADGVTLARALQGRTRL